MKLSDLTGVIEGVELLNFRDIDMCGISTDSRSVGKGEIFAAIRGREFDGHDFLEQAIERGASALVVDRPVSTALPTLVVSDTSKAAALLAKKFYGDPASGLILVGVTGTNGKTSTTFLLQSILSRAIGPTGIIGTVGVGADGKLAAATHTTPGSVDLYRIISDFLERGCRAVVMEVSSHATVQSRIAGLEFDIGIFTNITRDHLDYHGTLDNYVRAKEMFAGTLTSSTRKKRAGVLVYNMDDEQLVKIADRFTGNKISFGLCEGSNVYALDLEADLEGTRFTLVSREERVDLSLTILGSFSAYNALAAAAAAHALGIGFEYIKEGLEGVRAIPGRFQVVSGGEGPVVVVDYAHTPDALKNLLTFCRELEPKRILTVFGCGGDRDRGKRPIMARIAAGLSDVVYITDDNPRTEDPDKIVEDILAGTEGLDTPVQVLRDRREAIRKAVDDAGIGEIVVLAGKGHESFQIFGDRRVPFSDVDEAKKALGIPEVEHKGRA